MGSARTSETVSDSVTPQLSGDRPAVIQNCLGTSSTSMDTLPMNQLPFRVMSAVRRFLALFIGCLIGLGLLTPGLVQAADWNNEELTVPASSSGDTMTFSKAEVKAGRTTFNKSCGECHAGGITKTNHNVGLDTETLALATPPRDSVDGLVDYMKDPTSYDGEYSIADLHPSMRSADVWTKMRDLNDEDLRLMAGYILIAPKVQGIQWGGGKIYF